MSEFYALDFEAPATAGGPVNPANLPVLVCFGAPGQLQALREDQITLDALQDVYVHELTCHGGKFDLGYLKRAGIDLHRVVLYDTLVAQKVLAGNRRWPLSLEMVAQRYKLGGKDHLVSRLLRGGVPPSDVPAKLLEKYCRRDCELAGEVEAAQRPRLGRLASVVQTRCALTPALADIEFNGMRLDKRAVQQEFRTQTELLQARAAELRQLVGEVNLNSPKQVAELLYDRYKMKEVTNSYGKPVRTETGARATSEDILQKLRPTNAESRVFLKAKLEYAKAHALLSKCLTKMQECCERDGVLYATFNQNVTQTGRLSSTGGEHKIQFQNFPLAYKRLIVPAKGKLILEVDFRQLEFRVAVDLARDPVGRDDILSGRDVHAYTAQVLTKAGQPTSRQDAKPHTFKPLYGGQSGTEAERAYYQAFRQRYAQIYKTQLEWANEVLHSGELETAWGMRFYWPDTTMSKSGYISNTPSIFNYPIQALATAEILPIALTGLWHDLDGLESRIINTVHDSVVLEVDPEELSTVKYLVVDNFLTKMYNRLKSRYDYDFVTPLSVEIKVGPRWGEGEAVTVDSQVPKLSR